MKILILLSFIILTNCTKEYSCEGCYIADSFRIPPLQQPIKIPPRDSTNTIYNELISYYSFYIRVNKDVKKIYYCVQTKYIPGHYQIIDEIPVQSSPDSYYNGSFNIKSYNNLPAPNLSRVFDENAFQKGDTFRTFIQIRYKNASILETDSSILVY